MNLDAVGLSAKVIATMQGARAASTRSQYDARWQAFEKWCAPRRVVPFQAPTVEVLNFLQELMDRGLTFSTIKVYLAAISACHIGVDGKPVSQHEWVARFMKGARRLLPVRKSLVPPWDLAVVLDALCLPPFEPLESVDLKHLSLKTAMLVALTTAKRVSDIHALSVSPECARFGETRVVLKPNPAFIPKNLLSACNPVELLSFHPPPFASEEDRRLHCLCPVRALRAYVDRTRTARRSEQMFVSWDSRAMGKPITKVRLSQWIVETIRLAYTGMGMTPPEGLRAHSTRGMSASWGLCRGTSIQDVCLAANWASPTTFVSFYRLDVAATSLAHTVLGVAARRARARTGGTVGEEGGPQ